MATDQLPDRVAYAYIKNEDGTWRTNFFPVPIIGAPDGGAYVTAPAMAPAGRDRNSSGNVDEAAIKPTQSGERVSSYIAQEAATVWRNVPMFENTAAVHRARKCRMRSGCIDDLTDMWRLGLDWSGR